MTTTSTSILFDVSKIAPIDHREARTLAEEAYARFVDVVEQLGADQWSLPTACEGWTVRDLVGHVLGAMRAAASMGEQMSQAIEIKRRRRKHGGNETDIMTALQIERTAALVTDELVRELRNLVGPAAAGRARTPGVVRRFAKIPVQLRDHTETWRLGYLVDVILTRDAWLHKIDLCHAIGVAPVLTAEHDGRLVADVVADWARRHGQAFDLSLSGPAGGRFVGGGDEAARTTLELDAVEFCRILSGRAPGEGLLATEVPF